MMRESKDKSKRDTTLAHNSLSLSPFYFNYLTFIIARSHVSSIGGIQQWKVLEVDRKATKGGRGNVLAFFAPTHLHWKLDRQEAIVEWTVNC